MKAEALTPACGGGEGFMRRKDKEAPTPACGGGEGFLRKKEIVDIFG